MKLRIALLSAGLLLGFASLAAAAVRPLDITATVRLLNGGGATLRQEGTFAGTPFGSGRVRVSTQLGRGRGALVRFTFTTSRGEVRGSGNCKVTFEGNQVVYAGTARFTSGTGAYRRIKASGLRFSGRGGISGERFRVHITGRVRF